jgi:hypothetical protein
MDIKESGPRSRPAGRNVPSIIAVFSFVAISVKHSRLALHSCGQLQPVGHSTRTNTW